MLEKYLPDIVELVSKTKKKKNQYLLFVEHHYNDVTKLSETLPAAGKYGAEYFKIHFQDGIA